MTNKHSSTEKREFFRINKKEPCRFEQINLYAHSVTSSKLVNAISRNLSTNGISFTTKYPPKLSSIILVHLAQHRNQHLIEIEKRSYMFKRQVLGKVVRVEELKGEYEVGVAFVHKNEKLAKDLSELLLRIRIIHLKRALATVAIVCGIIFIVLIGAIIYLQFKETYQPVKKIALVPSNVGIKYEEVNFESAPDNESMNGWFVPADYPRGTILFCHGRAGNISGELNRVNFFHSMGFNVFVFDYRGYGKSSGQPSEQGLFDDAKAAYDYLVKRKDVDKDNIILVGESLGGAVAADLSVNRKFKAVILESTFVSLSSQAQKLYPNLPMNKLLMEKYNTLEKIKKIHVPKLIIHGKSDEVVPVVSAKALYQAAAKPKRFVIFEGGHSDGIYKISSKYEAELEKFFQDFNILPNDPSN